MFVNKFLFFSYRSTFEKERKIGTMFSFIEKRKKKNAKKLKLIEETQELWAKFRNIHNKVYSIKLSLKNLRNMEEEIRVQEMPPMLYNYCKRKGTNQMVKVLKPNMATLKEDAVYIQKSIAILESSFGVEKKNFELPNLDDGTGYKTKCNQFELLLESFEEQIKILKVEKETMEHPKNLTKELEPSENEQNIEESLSCNDNVRKMVSLNKRLGIFYQDLSIIENGLDNFEDDFSFNTKTKEIIPDQSNIFEMLVQGGLHLQFFHIRMKNVLEFNERLRN